MGSFVVPRGIASEPPFSFTKADEVRSAAEKMFGQGFRLMKMKLMCQLEIHVPDVSSEIRAQSFSALIESMFSSPCVLSLPCGTVGTFVARSGLFTSGRHPGGGSCPGFVQTGPVFSFDECRPGAVMREFVRLSRNREADDGTDLVFATQGIFHISVPTDKLATGS